jgi:hypothetical protein
MSDTRKTAIYCRTVCADADTITAQEMRHGTYADEHCCADIIPYTDHGAAGNTLDRPAMNRLTAGIKAGKIGAVFTVNPGRIARTHLPILKWTRLIRKHGVTFITLAEGRQNAAAEMLELTYRLVGDCLLPNVALNEPPDAEPLGYYGRIRRAFLKRGEIHRPKNIENLLNPLQTQRLPLCIFI